MLDIIALILSRQTEVWDNSVTYILNQDSIMLEGKTDHSFKNGDLCKLCGKGNIYSLPGSFGPDQDNNVKQTAENFECNYCHEQFSNYLLHAKDRIGFSDSATTELKHAESDSGSL
jgi:hypothetical protein